MNRKPKVGNLVVLCSEHISKAQSEGLGVVWEDYVGKPGIITKLMGVRCQVQWSNGQSSWPRRTVLKVLS